MKTLTINPVNWFRAFFMNTDLAAKPQKAMYHRSTTVTSKQELNQADQSPEEKQTKPGIGDLMRTAHRGNFSAGPTFLFHPGWFK
jgi:hypothetical protein